MIISDHCFALLCLGWLTVDHLTLAAPGVVAEGAEVVGPDGEGEGDGGEDGEGEEPDEAAGDEADGGVEDDPGGGVHVVPVQEAAQRAAGGDGCHRQEPAVGKQISEQRRVPGEGDY